MTGNRAAHPLLISLANLCMDFRMKSSNHAFLLLALLPIPTFIHDKKIIGTLESRLVHECLDFVLQPLKKAAEIGIMMTDALGYIRHCFTPLAAYMVDTPESALLACVAGKTSSVTMAYNKNFGDPFRHPPRIASTTLAQLQVIESKYHPWNDLKQYVKEAKKTFRLNGVHRPFWRDWPLSDPSEFLTSEPLHHWHKEFWDHDAKWCIYLVGGPEIDFRFSILHPHTGFRRFDEGISGLKQVTGREHRDIQRYIIPVIAGAVPRDVLIAVRALMDFRYLAQAPEIDDAVCTKIEEALGEFHDHKASIIESGGRRGKKGKVIDNWCIPKLEFFQSVVSDIRSNGVAIQWSADVTEHAHITEVKDPGRSSNNQGYEAQICRHLDRAEKCRRFNLATAVREAGVDFRGVDLLALPCDDDDDPAEIAETSALLGSIDSDVHLAGSTRKATDYFSMAEDLLGGDQPNALRPFRTFSCPHTAFHLTRNPSFKRMTVDEAAKRFQLPDLRAAIADYLTRTEERPALFLIGGRRAAAPDCTLPFSLLEVWTYIRLQTRAYYRPHNVLPARTIHAAPPCDKVPIGRRDTVIFQTDKDCRWPYSGIEGSIFLCHSFQAC